jgi:ATP-dependent DNA ligase
MKRLPPALAGPVTVALAKSAEVIPAEPGMSGGSVYELKWDGYRLVVVRTEQDVRLWSRNGTDLTARFPDIAAAATAQVPEGAVVDGEVVIWCQDHLSFDHLQRRLVSGVNRVAGLARRHPASYVAFDLLARGGRRRRRAAER